MSFEPCCMATAIGSLPHKDPREAVQVVLRNIPNAPIWPQLPSNGLNEQMEIQYSEGLPRVVIDRAKGRMYFDTTGDTSNDLATFYEKYCAEDIEAFKITPEFSKGIYALEEALKAAGGTRPCARTIHPGLPRKRGLRRVHRGAGLLARQRAAAGGRGLFRRGFVVGRDPPGGAGGRPAQGGRQARIREGVRAALDHRHVEPRPAEEALRKGLVDPAVLGLGDPVELDRHLERLRRPGRLRRLPGTSPA